MTKYAAPMLAALLLGGAGSALAEEDLVELELARTEIPEGRLLDVGIHLFDTGLPDDEYEKVQLEEKGIYEDVRKSEARYLPMMLKRTLEATGFWGAVRIVPTAGAVDLHVEGLILESNGKDLEVEIRVTDSRGKEWMKEKYDREADPLAYIETEREIEPFQSLYNEIANDMLKRQSKLDEEDFVEIRRVTGLKFASELAPDTFSDYLRVEKGRLTPARLPADEDPMMMRVSDIRERDYVFIDTLNQYYADLFAKMDESYSSWRAYSYEEQMALDELNRKAKWEKILGVAAIIGGGYMAAKSRSRAGSDAGQAVILGGMIAVQDGLNKSQEAKMHRAALSELAQSFDSEVSEILVDVEGEILRLTGSVETQYGQWKKLLKDIYATEVGLPVDPNQPPGSSQS